jgi:hypothetical protein
MSQGQKVSGEGTTLALPLGSRRLHPSPNWRGASATATWLLNAILSRPRRRRFALPNGETNIQPCLNQRPGSASYANPAVSYGPVIFRRIKAMRRGQIQDLPSAERAMFARAIGLVRVRLYAVRSRPSSLGGYQCRLRCVNYDSAAASILRGDCVNVAGQQSRHAAATRSVSLPSLPTARRS